MGTLFLQTPVSFLLSHNNYNRYSSTLIRKFIFLSLLHICFHLFFMTFRFTTSIGKDNGYMSCPHTHTYANTPHIIFKMLHNSPNFMLFYKTLALTLSVSLSAMCDKNNEITSIRIVVAVVVDAGRRKKRKEGSQYLTVNVCTVCTFLHQQNNNKKYMNIQFVLCVPYCYCCCCLRLLLQL